MIFLLIFNALTVVAMVPPVLPGPQSRQLFQFIFPKWCPSRRSEVIVNGLSFLFMVFFKMFVIGRGFNLFIWAVASTTTRIYFSSTSCWLKLAFGFSLNDFLKHFPLKIQFLVSAIHLCLDKQPHLISEIFYEHFLI